MCLTCCDFQAARAAYGACLYRQHVCGVFDLFNFDQFVIPKAIPDHAPLSFNTAASSKVALSLKIGFVLSVMNLRDGGVFVRCRFPKDE